MWQDTNVPEDLAAKKLRYHKITFGSIIRRFSGYSKFDVSENYFVSITRAK
jgi:hypothetical protein